MLLIPTNGPVHGPGTGKYLICRQDCQAFATVLGDGLDFWRRLEFARSFWQIWER